MRGVHAVDAQGAYTVKKLINAPEMVVPDALAGMAAAHSHLLRISTHPAFVMRTAAPISGKVALISGGGSGHEPLHAGFVGSGMLDAACPGAIFTSPVPDQMLAATRAVAGEAGALYIIKNYTGDVMNFEIAAELAQAEGFRIASTIINDDVAVRDSLYTAGRRGVGATVLLEKIVGAAAEAGADLATCERIASEINNESRSMGVALTSCTTPQAGRPTFELGANEIELGIGIHGEPGRQRIAIRSAAEITELLLAPILEDLPFRRGESVLAFVNGMGGTPLMELYIIYAELDRLLRGHGIQIARNLIGNYITALDMAGCSITLLRLNDERIRFWDAPVHTPALRWGM
jgi:dihydroxyacetone kinase-like protein